VESFRIIFSDTNVEKRKARLFFVNELISTPGHNLKEIWCLLMDDFSIFIAHSI
jgi:hypothetical protein